MLSRNCKAKSEASPVIACALFRNPEHRDAERGGCNSIPRLIQIFSLMTPPLFCHRQSFQDSSAHKDSAGETAKYHLTQTLVQVFPPVQSRI